ncbi:MAG: carboxypeptidase regulatory-like domain-containing protein, partial [Ilumatobacteraceae bacterium]
LVDGQPSRGVTVTVNGGEVNRSSGVVSQGAEAGAYAFDGLEAPGTYTLTFTGAGMIPQVRVVDLDPATGTENATAIDVSLSRERTAVRGLIRNVDGSPVGQAKVTLSNGADERTMLSADTPRGEFEFSNVAPGSYTLTASLTGTEPVVILVNVTAATPTAPIDIQLGAQAGLSGSVVGFDPTTRSLPVKLFLPGQFPNGNVLQTVSTDASGRYSFANLNAPADYVVAVYAGPAAADPLDSTTIRTEPGTVTPVPTFTVQLP